MEEKQIQNPFEIKKDAKGNFIKPDFVDAEIPNAPVVPTVHQIIASPDTSQDSPESPDISSEEAPIDSESPQQETEEESPVESQGKPKAQPPREHNLRRLREEKDRLEAERNLMVQELEMYRRAGGRSDQNPHERAKYTQDTAPQEDLPELTIGDDDLVEGKHLKQYVQQLQKQLKASTQQYAQQAAVAQQTALEIQIKAQYPDFDDVVNDGNLKDLRAAYPEVAASIYASQDLRTQAVTAYTMIKNLGIQQEDTHVADKERVKKNAAKPRPSSTATATPASPLGQAGNFAGGLTEDLKKQLIREMQEARSRR